MGKMDDFIKELENIDYYITNPLDFLYKYMENPTLKEIVECYFYIVKHNNIHLVKRQKKLDEMTKIITSAKPVQREEQEPVVQDYKPIESEFHSQKANYDSLRTQIEFVINYCNADAELDSYLASLSPENLIKLKLYFLREVCSMKKLINETIAENSSTDVAIYQGELNVLTKILERLKSYTHKREEEEVKENGDVNNSNIILLPNGKTSYFLQDIMQYPKRCREIKIAFDKIIQGYFLRTKDIKSIERVKGCLYEYRNPNGLRVLYVAKNNLITIISLFFKDKQKSTKIDGYYDDAQNRYNNSIGTVLENVGNPDFYIEQAELMGQVNAFLEANISVNKKFGNEEDEEDE